MILNIHALTSQSRFTNIQHSLFVTRHMDTQYIQNLNLLLSKSIFDLDNKYDLVVINYEVIAYRTSPLWRYLSRKLEKILKRCAIKILIVQDDYTNNRTLQDFIIKNHINYVYSSVKNNLDLLYKDAIKNGTVLKYLPTGLVEKNDLNFYKERIRLPRERIYGAYTSYRNLPRYFGIGSLKKSALIDEWKLSLAAHSYEKFRLEIGEASFGLNWLDNLSKYVFSIHHKGGANLIDKRGELRAIHEMLGESISLKNSIFRIIEKSKSRNGNFSASGPRLVESILLKCVLLAPNDIYEIDLQPDVSYIEIVRDNPKKTFEKLTQYTYTDFENISTNALTKLMDTKDFDYCEQTQEILGVVGKLDENRRIFEHSHGFDGVSEILRDLSSDNPTFEPNIRKMSKGLPELNSFVKYNQLSKSDHYFLTLIKNEIDYVHNEDLSLMYLNIENGIPLLI